MSSAPTPRGREPQHVDLNPIFARDGETTVIPLFTLPDGQLPQEVAYQLVHDESMLDGNARLNLATFVTTWMDDWAKKLYAETVDKNMIDKDEYPKTAEIETRCWRILADLWNAPDPERAIGTSTIGSSEAAMLAGLAMTRRWRIRQREAGKPIDKPNLVMSSAVQVCWEKFCNYWDIEMRLVPVSVKHPALDGALLKDFVDENTIGVIAIMGVTYTGVYEPVQEICKALDKIQKETGLDVPVHVDGASGGMIAPFIQPDLVWDFRLGAGGLHQHVGPQVWPGISRFGVGHLASRGVSARGHDLPRQLPGRQHADARAELLAPGRASAAPVLPLHALGARGLHRGAGSDARRCHVHLQAHWRDGRV